MLLPFVSEQPNALKNRLCPHFYSLPHMLCFSYFEEVNKDGTQELRGEGERELAQGVIQVRFKAAP